MTEKEHDVNYADPEEESKGNWEKKVCITATKILNTLNRLTYQQFKK